jgi:hypothetical protein
VSGTRPCRTQKIAFDETPLNAANPDVDARIGWLLAMSRMHHVDEALQDGRHFAQALAEAGFPASRSLLSRWDSGEIPICDEGMSAYEVALDLEVGQISSITGYIKASIPASRQLRTAAMNMAAIPCAQDFMVNAIAQYISDRAIQVITSPAGHLDRLPTRQAARLVLEIIEKPQNSLTYATGIWLAIQKVIRRDFDPAERTELDMLVLKAWRRDPTRVQRRGDAGHARPSAPRPGAASSGTSCSTARTWSAPRPRSSPARSPRAARGGVPQDPTYDDDPMLTRLIGRSTGIPSAGTSPPFHLVLAVRVVGDRRAADQAGGDHAIRSGCEPGWQR